MNYICISLLRLYLSRHPLTSSRLYPVTVWKSVDQLSPRWGDVQWQPYNFLERKLRPGVEQSHDGGFKAEGDETHLYSILIYMYTETGAEKSNLKTLYGMDRYNFLFYGLTLAAVSLLYLLIFDDMPVYGDAWGYGYNCARWFSDNGLPLVSSGTGRGETAGGHAAFYFWIWAVLMKVFGNTVKVAHILPSLSAFLAVAGTYRLGKDLGGRIAGILSGTAILLSPLFLAQAFRPLPVSAAMAASVWSLFYYRRKRYFAATMLSFFAVMMREQAIVIPVAYIAAEFYFFKERSLRKIVLLALPFLVPVINGVSNYIVNGFIFLEGNTPGVARSFSIGLFLERLKFFGYFLTGHFRWIPIGASIAILYGRLSAKKSGSLSAWRCALSEL